MGATTFALKMAQARARIWPRLACLFHVCSTSEFAPVRGSVAEFQSLGFGSITSVIEFTTYMGNSVQRKRIPLGPYRRPMHRVRGGWAFLCGRGTPGEFEVAGLRKRGWELPVGDKSVHFVVDVLQAGHSPREAPGPRPLQNEREGESERER